MELKVWVEGIQRVVCGVADHTTCQDVVVALANASGKTGRFTLVERWRDNERLLSPSESPLQVLHKWGEYAMDVQFILRHSDSRLKLTKKSRRTDKFSQQNGHSAIKKSLTFSGGHSYSIFPPKTRPPPLIRRPGTENSSLESLEDQHSVTSQSSRSTVSPYASFEGRPNAGTSFPSRSPFGSMERKGWVGSPRSSSSNSTPVGSLERKPRKASLGVQQPYSRKRSPSPKIDEYDLNKNISGGKSPAVNRNISDKAVLQESTKHVRSTSSSSSSASASTTTTSKEELLKLMSLQVEKLNVQESQLKVLQSEIIFWEDKEVEQTKQEAAIQSELERLHGSELEQNGELEELELVSWQDKLALERRQEQRLKAELEQLRSMLEKLEANLKTSQQKYKETATTLESERSQQQRDKKEQEIKVLQEISEVQKQINNKLVQHEENQKSIDSLQANVKELESAILDRRTQLTDLQKDVKEANMGQFTQVPTAWRRSPAPEGKPPPFSRSSSARPTTTFRRILHSPSLLKETVATERNPHGLWV